MWASQLLFALLLVAALVAHCQVRLSPTAGVLCGDPSTRDRGRLLHGLHPAEGMRNELPPALRAGTARCRLLQDDGGLAAARAASVWQPAQPQRRLQQAAGEANSTASGGGADKDDSDGSTATKPKRCRPSLVDVAREYPQLRQMVQLAAAGYNAFSVDGGKNFTVLLPINAALQALAAGVLGSGGFSWGLPAASWQLG